MDLTDLLELARLEGSPMTNDGFFGGPISRRVAIRHLMSLPPGVVDLLDSPLFRKQSPRTTTVTLPDGTTGYLERPGRTDDCFAACLATCLQVPIEEVPDPKIDERLAAGETAKDVNRLAWIALGEWLEGRRLQMTCHKTPPFELPRWLGVIPFPKEFNDHTVVVAGSEIVFDPAVFNGSGRPVQVFETGDIKSGFSFVKRN